jgi:hypothetical protein
MNDITPNGGPPLAIVGFDLPPATSIKVAVSRGDLPWIESTFEPEYRQVEINGPGCGGCPIATEEVALP